MCGVGTGPPNVEHMPKPTSSSKISKTLGLPFGARTGGAPILLGGILVVLALFFSGSVVTLLRVFPVAILGVILFLTGAQLALGSCEFGRDKLDRFVTLIAAALAAWNVGLAFVVGGFAWWIARRGWLKL